MAEPLPSLPLAARFVLEARGITPDEIIPLHGDAALAHANVSVGLASVLAYEAHVAQHLPHVDLAELRSLPDLAHAALEASREGAPEEEDDLPALLEEAYAIRRRLRTAAVALVEAGTLTAREGQKLGPDRGAVDVGADCLMLGSLFERRAEELEGRAPDAADVSRASEIGRALRARWKPAGAARKPGPDGMSAVERRDRLWTLLVLRHERLWAVGAYIYGHAVDEHVPPLHAPIRVAKKARARAPSA